MMPLLRARMILTLLICSVAALVTPLLLRVAVDGILSTEDESAFYFAFATIAGIELISVFCDFSFRRDLGYATQTYIFELKSKILGKAAAGEILIPDDDLDRLFLRDVRTVAQSRFRDRWMIAKETLTLAILGSVTFLVNSSAAVFIVFLLAIHVGFGIWSGKSAKARTKSWIELTEIEESLLQFWQKRNVRARDAGSINDLYARVVSRYRRLVDETLETDTFRDNIDSVFRIFRAVSIFGVLVFSIASVDRLSEAAGTITTLTLILFRITRPMEFISKWALQETKTATATSRVSKWLETRTITNVEHPDSYTSAKKLFEGQYAAPGTLSQLVGREAESDEYLECARIWRDRVRTKCDVLVYHDPAEFESFPGSERPAIVLVRGLASTDPAIRSDFESRILAKIPENVSITLCDPIRATDTPIDLLMKKSGKFGRVGTLDSENITTVLDAAGAARPELAELRTDIERFHRLNIPFSILRGTFTDAEFTTVRETIRKFDSIIRVRQDFYVVCFGNCSIEHFPKAIARVETAIGRKLELPSIASVHVQNHPNPAARNMDGALHFLAETLAASRLSAPEVIARSA